MPIKYPSSLSRWAVLVLTLLSVVLLSVVACSTETPEEEPEATMSLSSPAFQEGGSIPVKYTGDGQNISPPLQWGEPTQQTKTLALIVDDPDAPVRVFTHWVLFNIPADVHQLAEGIPAQETLENGALQGKNDFGQIGYGGPAPPSGSVHHYRFTLYALDMPLDLKPGVSKNQVLDAIKGHILAQGQLTGTYRR